MARRRTTPTPALAFLLLLSATAAASPQGTANDMNAGSRNSLTRLCKSARDAPLAGCTRGEFRTKNCTAQCQRDVLGKQAELQEACAGTREGLDTFVDEAMKGNLLQLVCNTSSNDDDNSTTRRPVSTTTRESAPASSSGSSTLPSVIRPPAPSDAGTAPPPGGPVIVAPPQPTGPGGDQIAGGDETRPNGLGGSPFDIPVSSGARSLGAGLMQAAAAACGLVFLLVR